MPKTEPTWEKAKWEGTNDPQVLATFVAYRIKAGRGYIWLRAYPDLFIGCRYHFTSSQGANSENSFSGCLPPLMNDYSLEEAQAETERRVRTFWGQNPYKTAPEWINMEERPFLENFGFNTVKTMTAEFMGHEYWWRSKHRSPRNRNGWERICPVEKAAT